MEDSGALLIVGLIAVALLVAGGFWLVLNHLKQPRHDPMAQWQAEQLASLTARRSEIDRAMFDPKSATPADANRTMTELMRLRADVESELNAVEAEWLVASEALEGVA